MLAFVDHGEVFLINSLSGENKNNEISSAGAGFRLDLGSGFILKMDVGFPIGGSKPSDGSAAIGHFYVSKVFKF